MDRYSRYPSPLGSILLRSDGNSLTGLWFDGQKGCPSVPEQNPFRTGKPEENGSDVPCRYDREEKLFTQVRHWLDVYFTGVCPDTVPPVSASGTAFQQLVWAMLAEIPYGQVITYGELAHLVAARTGRASMSAQAVGQAVAHNPVSILIPCHRVLGAGYALTGYAGGVERKRALLRCEGFKF